MDVRRADRSLEQVPKALNAVGVVRHAVRVVVVGPLLGAVLVRAVLAAIRRTTVSTLGVTIEAVSGDLAEAAYAGTLARGRTTASFTG